MKLDWIHLMGLDVATLETGNPTTAVGRAGVMSGLTETICASINVGLINVAAVVDVGVVVGVVVDVVVGVVAVVVAVAVWNLGWRKRRFVIQSRAPIKPSVTMEQLIGYLSDPSHLSDPVLIIW